ncbi:putative cyclin-SDS-like [Capsicum annuum]|uniref:Miraculin-like n=1 Tax=Capsicum annuum TaxID=4072 RepID=A0A1U8GTM5_CAPAN|nr:kunitz trypsin inhibitor 5 [Capsicum annuum]KAF3655851.1 putative cyclin-SDS-like [Capsicum annuum]KAF3669967.1 putative cyclin-SDS-like [Capsicum annuum]PHT81306.1 hypothetical protein T459_14321 [Capsicum annuum]
MGTTNYPKLLLILQILFSLSYLTTSQQPATTPITTTSVLDTDGRALQIGLKYTILPNQNGTSTTGGGGGLVLAAKNRPCPFYVMQENLESSSNGLPTRFIPVDNKQQVINLSTDLNIVFFAATICVQSTAWKVSGMDEITGRRYVMSGGMTGRPGLETISNWFRIEMYGNNGSYKIVFCPGVCSNCKVVCGNVGVFNENGKRWLGLNDEPLVVRFKKVLN